MKRVVFVALVTFVLIGCPSPSGNVPDLTFNSEIQSVESDSVVVAYSNDSSSTYVLAVSINANISFDDGSSGIYSFTRYNLSPGYSGTYTFTFTDDTPVSATCSHNVAWDY